MANSEFGELVNIDSLYYALVTSDTLTAYTAGASSYLAPAGEIQHEAKVDINTRYFDGVPMFTSVTEGATAVKIKVSGVPMKLAAILTGKPYDATKGVFIDTGDASATPDAAFSGRMELGDGGYRYFQYLKGKFSIGAQEAVSKDEKITAKTVDLTYTAVKTVYKFTLPDGKTDGVKGYFADTTDAAFTSAANWFSQVQTPATTNPPTALALSSSVPATNATGVLATAKPTLTFNNVIASDAVTLIKTTDNSVVTCTKTYDATGKILTISPSASLTAASVYNIVVAGVKDIYGQTLATSVIKFTVA
jgi:phi13 family phage major tail protein